MAYFLSLPLSPSIRVYFRKKNRRDFRDTSRKACKSLRFGGSQEIDSWLTNREGSLRQNGLRAEYSLLSLYIYTYIYIQRVSSELEPSRTQWRSWKTSGTKRKYPRLSVADGAPFSKIHSNLGPRYIKEGRGLRYRFIELSTGVIGFSN